MEPTTPMPSEVEKQLMMYAKLCNENNISLKNAWKLPITDLLMALCHRDASTSLANSIKIYRIIVGDRHSETLKLDSTMARVSEDAAYAGNVEMDNDHAPTCSTSTHIVDLRPPSEYSRCSSEYTFNSKTTNLTGTTCPSHWRSKAPELPGKK